MAYRPREPWGVGLLAAFQAWTLLWTVAEPGMRRGWGKLCVWTWGDADPYRRDRQRSGVQCVKRELPNIPAIIS